MIIGIKFLVIMSILSYVNSIPHLPGSSHLKFSQSILVMFGHVNSNFTTYLEGDQLDAGKLWCWTKIIHSYCEAEYVAENEVCRNGDELSYINKTSKSSSSGYKSDAGDGWNVDVNEVKEGQLFTVVTLWTKSSSDFINLVLTTCCWQPFLSDANDEYFLASLLLVAYLTPLYPLNTLRGVINSERSYNEQSGEMSSCQCDMTEGYCDTYCCCDKDCENDSSLSFDCCSGMYCGFLTEDLLDWKCNLTVYSPASDLHSIICIEWDNSPFLGYYFHDYSKINDLSTLNYVLQKSKESFSQFVWKSPTSNSGKLLRHISDGTLYHYGEELQVAVNDDGKFRLEPLLLPFSIYNDKCTGAYPVSYLKPFKSLCNVQIKEICMSPNVAFSELNAERYVFGAVNNVNSSVELLRTPHSKEVVDVNVNYICASNPYLFLTSDNRHRIDNFNSSQNMNFLNASCLFESFVNESKPVPFFSTGICHNVAVEVSYDLFWQEGQILVANITVILADVMVGEHDDEDIGKPFFSFDLTQKFSASFHHISILETILNKANETVYARSGNLGYEFGHSVLVAVAAETLDTEFLNETLNFTAQLGPYLNIWKPGVNGFCDSALGQPVLFGENVLSGCLFRATLRDLSNCTALRHRVKALQEQLVLAEYVSRVGDPDVLAVEDFVLLLREEEENDVSEASGPREPKQKKESLSWQQWLEARTTTCTNIPAHVEIDVIYAESNRLGSHPVYTIVGTRLSFYGNTWTWHCSPGCHSDAHHDDLVFPLTSAVHFKILEEPRLHMSRYWHREDAQFCPGETCWEELLYPMTELFHTDPLPKALACVLLLTFFVVPWIYLSR